MSFWQEVKPVPHVPMAEGLYCDATQYEEQSAGFICTRKRGHTGPHVAHTGLGTVGVYAWLTVDPDLELDEGL